MVLDSKWADAPDEDEVVEVKRDMRKNKSVSRPNSRQRTRNSTNDQETTPRESAKEESRPNSGRSLLDRIDKSFLVNSEDKKAAGHAIRDDRHMSPLPKEPKSKSSGTKSASRNSLLDRIDQSYLVDNKTSSKTSATPSPPSTASSNYSRQKSPDTAQTTPGCTRPSSRNMQSRTNGENGKKTDPAANKVKMELLKKKIEEQKKLLNERTHKEKQKELLAAFLEGDEQFAWDDEKEEDELINKLKSSQIS
ncbi:GFD1 mRNA transport factor [Nakaseomyces glabratus]|nr:GFD1 mRNA transport factor [Nakaseomyces glabratus]KAH7588250.1 GFD1 mRNA transport factor [Nakaseomyces glabratus]KAH7592063.1 GFD1 mRNA transport factor [Nakaseomyces glabratus]KAH7600708.1 GFD1 mRNA transport factor [Nakaseomyces glabratus]KAH7613146.1 GFD1 mRNA transport factor [Nakaseomyces glabratus]